MKLYWQFDVDHFDIITFKLVIILGIFRGMIKASELRLFNIVSWNGGIDTVVGIEHDYPDCNVKLSDNVRGGVAWVNEKDIEGIALALEWMGRCGFVKDEHSKNRYTKGAYAIIIGYGGAKNSFCLINSAILATFQYIHQLQNLYHSLAGEELTIKEPTQTV